MAAQICAEPCEGTKKVHCIWGHISEHKNGSVRQFPSAFPPRCINSVTDSSCGFGGRGWISSCALKQHCSGDTSWRERIARFDSNAKHNAHTVWPNCNTVRSAWLRPALQTLSASSVSPSSFPWRAAESLSLSLPLSTSSATEESVYSNSPPFSTPSARPPHAPALECGSQEMRKA